MGIGKQPHFKIDQPKKISNKKDISWKHIRIDEQSSLLFDEEGTELFLGGVGQMKANGNYYPAGEGLSRTLVKDPVHGETAYEYYFGSWKRGSRHGKALVKCPDGTYCNTTWRWDRLKSISEEEPSAEDIARLETEIARLEKIMSLL